MATLVRYTQLYQTFLSKATPHTLARWATTISLLVGFMLRVVLGEGWFLIAYALGIYMLNLLLAFLTPKFDPAIQLDNIADADGPGLPVQSDDEFRPFIRRLPEFQFWHSATRAIAISLLLSVTRLTDVPVFWPILLIYFLFLVSLTLHKQVQHMIKYKYLPFDMGKLRK